ncbi:MAG: PGPGW domain-containing protein [Gammaproteobacteria bacterium]
MVVGVVGATVVLLGIAMIVLPGPAFIVIPIGLAILGIEFAWARRWLGVVKAAVRKGLPNGRSDQKQR